MFMVAAHTKKPEAIILCGGLGTRFRPVVPNIQKTIAPLMGDKTCLDIIAGAVFSSGTQKIILAIGYRGEDVRRHVEETSLYTNKAIYFSEEKTPLGTGGAVKRALTQITTKHFLVINGDTPFSFSLDCFFRFHIKRNATLSIAVFPRTSDDSGGIHLHQSGKIIGFKERAGRKEMPFSSGGAYLMKTEVVRRYLPKKNVFSIEEDFFPSFIKKYPSFGYRARGDFFDIGTPERYQRIKSLFADGGGARIERSTDEK